MVNLSACIIARNEEKNLAACLQSIKGQVDEIILVDTGSTDQTLAIAKKFACRIFSFVWEDDFSKAKNFAMRQARGKWILFLDADEYFSLETRANLRKTVTEYDAAMALQVKMVNVDADRENAPMDYFYKIRLFKKMERLQYVGAIHENLSGLAQEDIARIPEEKLLLYHTGYSASRLESKCRRNLEALKKNAVQGEDEPRRWIHMADAYYGLRDYAQASQCAMRGIALGYAELSYGSRPYRIVIASLRALGEQEALAEWIDRAIQAYPSLPDFYFEKGHFAHTRAAYDEALAYALQALALEEGYQGVETNLFEKELPIACEMVAKILEMKRETELAEYYYEKLLRLNPYREDSFQALYHVLRDRGDAEILRCLNGIYAKTDAKAMRFLATMIGRIDKGKVFLYYAQLHAALSGEPIAAQDVLLRKDDFTGAVSCIADKLRVDVNFLALSLLLREEETALREKAPLLPEAFRKVLLKYVGESVEEFSAEEIEVYDALLSGLLRTLAKEKIARFSELARDLPSQKVLEFADRLQNLQWYEAAATLHLHCLNEMKEAGNLRTKLGVSYFRLERYEEAAVYLREAAALDEKDEEARTYLAWMEEKKTGEAVK